MKTFVPCSTWRSTGSYANVFYLESFIEELARAAGKDPVEYRRALIAPREPESFEDNAKDDWLLALNIVAEKAGWGRTLPKGTGIGFAIDDRKSVAPRGIALVALAATVSVTPSGEVTVERLDIVHDQGHAIINPEAAERQVRGMMAWGLGPVFSQEITFTQRRPSSRPTTTAMRPSRWIGSPRTSRSITSRRTAGSPGIGEEVVPLVAPAICNAIHMATGKRVRSLPLSHQDLSWT